MSMVIGRVAAAAAAVMLSAGGARAASFDCGKALAGIEHLICNDADLNSLDQQLAAAFAGAMDRSASPAKVRQGQLAWLKSRDGCANDRPCLRAAYDKRIKMLTALSDPPAGCPGSTTPEVESCGAEYDRRADRELGRYVDAARKRLLDDAKEEPDLQGPKDALARFDTSQAAWVAYRKAECDAVYTWWSDGTIRGSMYQDCWLETTKARSAAILSTWLQFMDSTPPLMPPPSAK